MKYITIFGELKGKYIRSGKSVYWLTEEVAKNEWGFALLKKTSLGSYIMLRFKHLDLMSEPGEFFKVRETLRSEY